MEKNKPWLSTKWRAMTNIANNLAVYLKKRRKDEPEIELNLLPKEQKKIRYIFSLCTALQPKRGGHLPWPGGKQIPSQKIRPGERCVDDFMLLT